MSKLPKLTVFVFRHGLTLFIRAWIPAFAGMTNIDTLVLTD